MLFNQITWMQYLAAIAVLLVIYYAVVFVKYFLPEYKAKFIRVEQQPSGPLAALQYETAMEPEEEYDPLVSQTDALIAAIKQSLKATPTRETVQAILRQYPDIKTSPLRPAINELIVTEWEKYSADLLTEAEVNEWWEA